MSIMIHYGTGAIAIPQKALSCNAGVIELRCLMLLCARPDLAAAYPEGI